MLCKRNRVIYGLHRDYVGILYTLHKGDVRALVGSCRDDIGLRREYISERLAKPKAFS